MYRSRFVGTDRRAVFLIIDDLHTEDLSTVKDKLDGLSVEKTLKTHREFAPTDQEGARLAAEFSLFDVAQRIRGSEDNDGKSRRKFRPADALECDVAIEQLPMP